MEEIGNYPDLTWLCKNCRAGKNKYISELRQTKNQLQKIHEDKVFIKKQSYDMKLENNLLRSRLEELEKQMKNNSKETSSKCKENSELAAIQHILDINLQEM